MIRLSLSKFKTAKALGNFLIILGVGLAIVPIIILVHQHKTEPKPPPGALTSKSAPSSVKPKLQTELSYNVPPSDPRYIAIPSIGIANTPILRLGITSAGQIAVPDNIYDTGWYDGSSRPGKSGAMFIYGHVSSWTADGIFYNLKKLKSGDQITITRGDNTAYTYQVISMKIYSYNNVDMNQVLAPVQINKPGLNLMTCTGKIIKGTSEFNERLVVFSSLKTS
jgi:LPXTG-site transpeptidase (sortase) family protein